MSDSSSSSDEDGVSSFQRAAVVAMAAINNNMAAVASMGPPLPPSSVDSIDHRTLPRGEKKQWKYHQALHCIKRDYTGPIPQFNDKQFEVMFRVSRSRFDRLRNDIGNHGDPFYICPSFDATGKPGMSLEAKLLLPLKTLAYGVPPHVFCDYFQMSFTHARKCYHKFTDTITKVYAEEYLRAPDAEDLRNIFQFHELKHGKKGMLGSLDCSHSPWKNCPVAWQQSFKGAKKMPTVVLEAMCDQHLWFWHAAFGYSGALNDINIFNLSPLKESWIDGSFAAVELESGLMPHTINNESFDQMCVLCDGIYPRHSRFVKAQPEPSTKAERKFTKWQESARKDIERAFGVLQGKFQCVCRPVTMMNSDRMSNMMSCSLIIHNWCVSDRVMEGDVMARYNPMNTLESGSTTVSHPADYTPADPKEGTSTVGIARALPSVRRYVADPQRWKDLKNLAEHQRLTYALQQSMLTKK